MTDAPTNTRSGFERNSRNDVERFHQRNPRRCRAVPAAGNSEATLECLARGLAASSYGHKAVCFATKLRDHAALLETAQPFPRPARKDAHGSTAFRLADCGWSVGHHGGDGQPN